jgi:putative DNA primase/helicase
VAVESEDDGVDTDVVGPAPSPAITIQSSSDWRLGLIESKKGLITTGSGGTANAATVLSSDARWSGVLAYDEFGETIVTLKPPPWRVVDVPHGGARPGDWTDEDTIRTKFWLIDSEYRIGIGSELVLEAVRAASHRVRFHPVRDWVRSIKWDGTKRLPTWLIDVMGAEDTEFTRSVGQCWAISAMARLFAPGCKVDTVPIFEGDQGTFKSSTIRALAGDAWFLEMNITDVSNKDAMQVLRRKWIAELPEFDGLSRAEQSNVKNYFSRQTDTYRPSYGKMAQDFQRQIVFAASTNKHQYLGDETGGRRYWPIRCRGGNVTLARSIRDQFWAEAHVRYECGEPWHITDPAILDASREVQDARFRSDPWEISVAEWLAKPSQVGVSKAGAGITTADVLEGLGLDTAKRDNGHSTRVGSILRRLGWEPGQQEWRNGVRARRYRPAGASDILVPVDAQAPFLPNGAIHRDEEPDEDSFPPTHVRLT